MTIPDPPWKQKTRPCPFYSQGRCLFSDSCSFLHDVKIRVKQPNITITDSTPDVVLSSSLFQPESVAPNPRSDVRSPPRSPRLSSLLLALGDAIESDEDEQVDAVISQAAGANNNPVVPDEGADREAHEAHAISSSLRDHALGIAEEVVEAAQTIPVDPAIARDSIDLLSPIEVKLAPAFLGQLEGPSHREDSIDSGYADNWHGPSPFALSPPRQHDSRRYSTLSLLSSPFGSPARALSPAFGPSVGSAWPSSPLFSPVKSITTSRPTSSRLSQSSDDLDSPTEYHRRLTAGSPGSGAAESDEDLTLGRLPLAALHDATAQRLASSTDIPARKAVDEFIVSPAELLHQHPAFGEALKEPFLVAAQDSSAECHAELVTSSLFVEHFDEEDTTKLNRSYYTQALCTNSTRNVELHASIPVASLSMPGPGISPTPSIQDSSRHIPEFVAGSSHDVCPLDYQLACGNRSPLPPQSALSSPSSIGHSPRVAPISSRLSPLSERGSISHASHRVDTKVPFGFRHIAASRSRESSNLRPGSAPPVRHRPPALAGLGFGRSHSLNGSGQDYPEEPLPSPRPSSRLRPLRLSILLNSSSSLLSLTSSNVLPAVTASSYTDYSQPPSPSVKSDYSLSNNPLLSSAQSDYIPRHKDGFTVLTTSQSLDNAYQPPSLPLSAPVTYHTPSPWNNIARSPKATNARPSYTSRPNSRLSQVNMEPPIYEEDPLTFDDDNDDAELRGTIDSDLTINFKDVALQSTSPPPSFRPMSAASFVHEPSHAIATPRPTLLFAIASDDIAEVRRVLESGEASPNDDVGPQSALAFALTSGQLRNKTEIVKLLLAHGANPSSVKATVMHSAQNSVTSVSRDGEEGEKRSKLEDPVHAADPATRYYISRAQAPQTRRASALIHRTFFRPLTKVRYEMIGQDRALEQLFRVLSMPSMAPMVVLLCGPSGHGKSLLARRFGSLLDVPTHTVNMTTLRSTHDIWRSYSMNPYEEPSASTLADFLIENEGKRCVVVLDEIEKTENDKILSSLLMPWELGRCSFEAGHRHVNVSKVIWLGTSNIGHDLVFEHHSSRASPAEPMTRDEYVDLMGILRPVVSDRLGPSVLSRVTTVLPFVPFTADEKLAIATEALFTVAEDAATRLPAATVEKLVRDSLQAYVPAEGARSLYRAVSTQLLETL